MSRYRGVSIFEQNLYDTPLSVKIHGSFSSLRITFESDFQAIYSTSLPVHNQPSHFPPTRVSFALSIFIQPNRLMFNGVDHIISYHII